MHARVCHLLIRFGQLIWLPVQRTVPGLWRLLQWLWGSVFGRRRWLSCIHRKYFSKNHCKIRVLGSCQGRCGDSKSHNLYSLSKERSRHCQPSFNQTWTPASTASVTTSAQASATVATTTKISAREEMELVMEQVMNDLGLDSLHFQSDTWLNCVCKHC